MVGESYMTALVGLMRKNQRRYGGYVIHLGVVFMFLGVTFPVGKEGHVSLVLGGWAGAITGISNLDGLNASENKTTQYHNMPEGQWFKVKIMVTSDKIQCWLDDKQLVDVSRDDYEEYDTHGAVVDTKPFGMFSYSTWGRVKNLKAWKLD